RAPDPFRPDPAHPRPLRVGPRRARLHPKSEGDQCLPLRHLSRPGDRQAGLVPSDLVLLNPAFRPEMLGIEPPNNVYAHIAGIDLIRTGEHDFFVLEDNFRTPSGVSYVLENREIMMRLFPDAFAGQSISPVGNYPERLLHNLRGVAPSGAEDPVVVLLTPGRYNSAYFEHVFLAEQMGIELVEGGDLFVRDGYVWM